MQTDRLKILGRIIRELVILVLAVIALIPIVMVILGSFKNPREAAELSLSLPSEWIFTNIIELLTNGLFLRAVLNSSIYVMFGTSIALVFNSMAAFIIARNKRKITTFLYYFFIAGLILPPFVIPTIKLMQTLHLMNTYRGVILLFVAGQIPFMIFMITGFVKGIPRELDEAAFVDGCKPVRAFFQIIFPLMKPVTVTLAVWTSIGIWNDLQTGMYFVSTKAHYPITLWLYKNVSQHETQWEKVFPNLLVAMLPMIIIYVFAQKYIVDGMTAGAVKG